MKAVDVEAIRRERDHFRSVLALIAAYDANRDTPERLHGKPEAYGYAYGALQANAETALQFPGLWHSESEKLLAEVAPILERYADADGPTKGNDAHVMLEKINRFLGVKS